MVGTGFNIARLTIQNLSFINLTLSSNRTSDAQNPRRDTSIPTVIAGLQTGGDQVTGDRLQVTGETLT